MIPEAAVPIGFTIILFTIMGFALYEAFGPPSKNLTDPFDEHDD